ncbi:MAG TPA: AAA family ATPase, partial [Stellaceae bacterium]|nr:AAA family ATPase [Stellaceae bacterium]
KMKTDERHLWRKQAADLGWEHRTVMEGVVHERPSDAERFERAYEFAVRYLADEFRTAAVVDHEKLGLYAARGLIGAGIRRGPDDIKRVVALLEERGLRVNDEQVALVVGLFDDRVRVATTAQIQIEQSLADKAKAAARDRSGALSVQAIEAAIAATGVKFTAEQKAAIYALGQGGTLTMLTGVAGAGKTTLLEALVTAWHADTRFSVGGREVIGAALAWRQADALEDAGIRRTYALAPLLRMIDSGEFQPTRNTVLVLDEVSQIGPRPLLQLLELQQRTGMTVKMLGDREQAQAIEAGDAIEILRRALPPEALPELLTTMRQATRRGREIAGLFRDGEAARALAIKREDGHAMLLGGDYDQVVERIADLYIARRDMLRASGAGRGITVSTPTNDDVAAISRAIRRRLQERGEIAGDEILCRAIDQDNRTYDLPIATGDRLRLFRRTWGTVDGHLQRVGDNGDIVEVLGHSATGLRLRIKDGRTAAIEWRRFHDEATGRVLLGFGHALTINAAAGITSDEHIDALPRGTTGITAFNAYTAESRSRGTTWTLISEAAVHEAERYRRALGDITPVTQDDLWARAAEDMSQKPYKALAVDLLAAALADREWAVDTFIACRHRLETAQLDNPNLGRDALRRLRARAINQHLSRHRTALGRAIAENGRLIHDLRREQEAPDHTAAAQVEATDPKRRINQAAASAGPGH